MHAILTGRALYIACSLCLPVTCVSGCCVQGLWDSLDTLDAHTWIIEPMQPKPSCVHMKKLMTDA